MSTDTIDITDWKMKDDELKLEILKAVRSTQSLVIQPLPNRLVMTKSQYDMLQPDPDLRGIYPKEQIYYTPDNAMDVIIK
jgi:hypothetical protein